MTFQYIYMTFLMYIYLGRWSGTVNFVHYSQDYEINKFATKEFYCNISHYYYYHWCSSRAMVFTQT